MGRMPKILYVSNRIGREGKGETRMMPANPIAPSLLGTTSLGRVMSDGNKGDSGSVKYKAEAVVTAVPRLWPRRTVLEEGWSRSERT